MNELLFRNPLVTEHTNAARAHAGFLTSSSISQSASQSCQRRLPVFAIRYGFEFWRNNCQFQSLNWGLPLNSQDKVLLVFV
jgi:hypothetical protein